MSAVPLPHELLLVRLARVGVGLGGKDLASAAASIAPHRRVDPHLNFAGAAAASSQPYTNDPRIAPSADAVNARACWMRPWGIECTPASKRLQLPILTPSQLTAKTTCLTRSTAKSRPQASANVQRSRVRLAQKWPEKVSHDPQLEPRPAQNGATMRFVTWAILGSNQ